MGELLAWKNLDLLSWFYTGMVLLSGALAVLTLLTKFFDCIHRPVKWLRGKNEDHELILKTMDSLNGLQERLADMNEERTRQIQTLIIGTRESLGDRINQKYKYYLSVGGIPEDEIDEFTRLHAAYQSVGGNHSGDAKYHYCMEHLAIIPVETRLRPDKQNPSPNHLTGGYHYAETLERDPSIEEAGTPAES